MSELRWTAKCSKSGWVFGETEQDALDCIEADLVDGTLFRMPTSREVCGRCRGEGVHDHPAFSNGITSSEWAEWDADEREDYCRGVYDVTCSECHGRNVVDVVDTDRLNPDVREALFRWWQSLAECRRQERMEREMGA